MKQFASDKIKNIAFLGHSGSGKTTLVDSVLYCYGAIERIGKAGEGSTVMDFDTEEKKRKCSVSTAVYALE
ncbi:MAG: elongation factor G, partial [Clostridia bacterium]|nr:elongation factor G [Clostridia bacterium]